MKSLYATTAVLAAALVMTGVSSGRAHSGADTYYPPEEAAERKALVYPSLLEVRPEEAVLKWPVELPLTLRVGARHLGWELVAVIAGPEPLAVLERDFSHWGLLAYVGTKGPSATLRKAVGKLGRFEPAKVPQLEHVDTILKSNADILGNRVLAHGDDPSYEGVVRLLPPLQSYTLLGTTTSREKIIAWPDGRLGAGVLHRELEKVLFDPASMLTGAHGPSTATKQGLIGNYLPVIDYAFSRGGSKTGWEEMAFASGKEQLQTHVCLRMGDGQRIYWRLPAQAPLKDGAEFYQALLNVQQEWERFFAGGMQLTLPEDRVADASKAAIMRALISQVGVHPKYGVGAYSADLHDSFPPTTIHLNECLLDWGFPDEVKARLSYYLSHFVKRDGAFDYYGPALSEYGQMLALAARYVRITGDMGWLREYLPALQRIIDSLTVQIEAARKQNPPDAEDYGLLWGSAEADTRGDKQFYFSGNLWCWRGLVELGELLDETGKRQLDPRLGQLAQHLLGEAKTFRSDVLAALNRSLLANAGAPFLPPIAGMQKPFAQMTEARLSNYTNYRYWPEMLSAGMLAPNMRDAIISFRTSHGGELAGTTRFEEVMDDWPYTHYAWGLLEAGEIRHYLLGFYGHLALHETPGTFTAFESVQIKGDDLRSPSADFCVPAQLVTPQMLRWMIAWEPWDKQELWLAPAVPERWLMEGFSARGISTRCGKVDLNVAPAGNGLTAQIQLTSPHPELKVLLRLRNIQTGAAPRITVEGTNEWKWDVDRGAVELRGSWIHVVVNLRR